MPPLPDGLQDGGTISPSVFQGVLRSFCPLLGSLPSFTGALYGPLGSTPAKAWTFKAPVFELHWLSELTIISSSHFPHEWLWGNFSYVILCALLSFSLLPLSVINIASPLQHAQSFPPQNLISAPPTFHSSLFSLPSCIVCSVTPQIDFLGFQNDSVVI